MDKKEFTCLVSTEKHNGSVRFRVLKSEKIVMLSWTSPSGFLCRCELMRIKLTRLSENERRRFATYRKWLKEIE